MNSDPSIKGLKNRLLLVFLIGVLTGAIAMAIVGKVMAPDSTDALADPFCLNKFGQAQFVVDTMREAALRNPTIQRLDELVGTASVSDDAFNPVLKEPFELFLNPDLSIWRLDYKQPPKLLAVLHTVESGNVCQFFYTNRTGGEMSFRTFSALREDFIEIHGIIAATTLPNRN